MSSTFPPGSSIQRIDHPSGTFDVLRLDISDPLTGGNKSFKLRLNLKKALAGGKRTIVTAGGAVSNHIAATAEVCRSMGLECAGIIRGEEQETHTLLRAKAAGMRLVRMSRIAYTEAARTNFADVIGSLGENVYFIPEGGSNCEGIAGCAQILSPDMIYDTVFCAVGTGTTFAGLVASAGKRIVAGISVLKGVNSLPEVVSEKLSSCGFGRFDIRGNEAVETGEWRHHFISNSWTAARYGSSDKELLSFKSSFEREYGVPLDYIYTSRLFYAATRLLLRGALTGRRVLVIHSGGLQGNADFEARHHLKPIL